MIRSEWKQLILAPIELEDIVWIDKLREKLLEWAWFSYITMEKR